jgi:hypothetical protein
MLRIHELDFEVQQHVDIIRNIRISYHPCMRQPDGSSCGLLVLAIATYIA